MNPIKRSRSFLLPPALFVLLSFTMGAGQALAQTGPERGGFTILLDLGVGVQKDDAIDEAGVGLAGLNLGVGGFLSEDAALMFRITGTNVSYDTIFGGSVRQVSGVAGGTIQYWLSDRINVEAGPGIGFWNIEGVDERSFGAILGAGITLFNSGKHNLQFGVNYSPAFTDPATVHNFGFTFGYQFL